MRKGQLVTLDMVSGILLFLIFLAIVFLLIFLIPGDEEESFQFEMVYAFDNLEANMRVDGVKERQFMTNYRVNATRLLAFKNAVESGEVDLDVYLLGAVQDAHGIGLAHEGYDTCLYFTDNDGSYINMNGRFGLGNIDRAPSGMCHNLLENGASICEGYEQAMSVFRPVLYDVENVDNNRIIQMNMVACRK